MSDDKEADRSKREQRRGQQTRENDARRATQSRAANLDSKALDEKEKLNRRIGKLVAQGYSIESVAKRLGVTARRVNLALDANGRR